MTSTVIAIIGVISTIIGCTIGVVSFFGNRKNDAIKELKENHQELIEYQIKEIKESMKELKVDLKDIKLLLGTYKDDLKKIVDEKMAEHIKAYHSRTRRK